MILSFKDFIKLIGISLVCFCSVFVCTFFLNFYIDLSAMTDIPQNVESLYKALLSTAQFTCAICGGFLGLIAIIMLLFYVKLYINSHLVQLGTLKAMGYSNFEIATKFWVFGLSVLLGTGIGYGAGHAAMPYIYRTLSIDGLPEVAITYHPLLLLFLVILPTLIYSALSCLFAYLSIRKPVGELLRGKSEKVKTNKVEKDKPRTFLKEMLFKCIGTRKMLVFFITFGAFCFSGMVQMGLSMNKISPGSMSKLILVIGLILAVVSLFMAITTLINANRENVSIMKAFGYDLRECTIAVFGGYLPFILLGFAIGTVYQYVLLSLMINLIFKDVDSVLEYSFDMPYMFITLAAFIVFIVAVMAFYIFKLKNISIKQAANE